MNWEKDIRTFGGWCNIIYLERNWLLRCQKSWNENCNVCKLYIPNKKKYKQRFNFNDTVLKCLGEIVLMSESDSKCIKREKDGQKMLGECIHVQNNYSKNNDII